MTDLAHDQTLTPPAQAAAVVEPVVSAPPERVIDPAYVAQLEAAYREQQGELNRYAPVKDELDWMLADETRATSVKKYREAYDTASKPQRPPELEDLYRHIDESTAPARAWITKQEAAEVRQQTEARQSFERENIAYAQRLQSQNKYDQGKMIEIAAYADSMATRLGRNVGIEEAYKTLSSFGGAPKESPPPSLRADAGAIGVPGNSTTDNKEWVSDFHGALVKSITAARKAS